LFVGCFKCNDIDDNDGTAASVTIVVDNASPIQQKDGGEKSRNNHGVADPIISRAVDVVVYPLLLLVLLLDDENDDCVIRGEIIVTGTCCTVAVATIHCTLVIASTIIGCCCCYCFFLFFFNIVGVRNVD
jgi:hypothetical protein